MFPLYFHYEDVSRQDPLLKLNHANVMEVPGLCEIRVVPKAPYDFIIKNVKLAMEIPCGQKFIQTQRGSTGKSFRSNPFLGSNKDKKGYVSDLARQSTLRGHGMSNFSVRISIYTDLALCRLHRCLWNLFTALPLVRNLPFHRQFFFFSLSKLIFILLLSRVAFCHMGSCHMEDLQRAISQFYPGWSGGMEGGSSNPPGPSDHSWMLAPASADGLGREQEEVGDPRISLRDPTSGMTFLKVPSPGERVEVFEIPETPPFHSGASEAEPVPADPGQPSNSRLADEVREEVVRLLHRLEPSKMQEAKKVRLLNRLDLDRASSDLLLAIRAKLQELRQ